MPGSDPTKMMNPPETTGHEHPEKISVAATVAEDDLMAAKQSVFHKVERSELQHHDEVEMTSTSNAFTPKQPTAKKGQISDSKLPLPEKKTTKQGVIAPTALSASATTRKDILLNFAIGMDGSGTGGEQQQPGMPPPSLAAAAPPTVALVASSPIRGFSSPGAYAQDSPFTEVVESAPPEQQRAGAENPTHPVSAEEDSGTLAEAEPVVLPSGTAEPVHSLGQPKSSAHRMSWFWILLGLALLVVIVTVMTVVLVGRDDNKESSSGFHPQDELVATTNITEVSSSNTANNNNLPGEDDFWNWDLPFELPDATRIAFEEDMDHSTPVSKAFQWMKLDPNLDTYTSDRQLQRFVLSLFYHSMNGQDWIHRGNEVASVTVELPDFVLSHYLNRGRDGPARHRQLALEEDEAWHLSTNPSSGGLRKLQPPGDGGTCGGFIPEVGGLKEVALSSKPWLSYNDSECSWFSAAPAVNLTVCNNRGEMVALDLELNNLVGTLPAEITLLSSLNILNLWGNPIQWNLFSDLGRLTNLRFLYGRKTALIGTVPPQLGKLSKLWQFDINQNSMTGTLPQEFWSLSNIEQIHIGDNQFSGSIHPDIGSLFPKLRTLRLRQNSFTGTLPTSLGLLSDLWAVALWTNQFSGTLPSEVGNLLNLHFLLLQANQISGTVPSELARIPHMVQLKLTGNTEITGQLPTELGLWNESLYVLDVRGTSITGTIPEGLCSVDCVLFDCSPTLCGCDCPCSNSTR